MDEIWETLFNKRLPIHQKEQAADEGYNLYTPTEWKKKRGLTCNWKESYFLSLFSFCNGFWNTECYCDNPDHFPKDLLYGLCDYYPPTHFYRFFNDGSITSLHGIEMYTTCSAFPERYRTVYHCNEEEFLHETLIDTLVDVCNVKLKHLVVEFFQNNMYMGIHGCNCATKLEDEIYQQKLSQLLSLLQSVEFITSDKQDTTIAKTFLDSVIPCDSIERVSFNIFDDDLEFLLSYFLKPSQCHLKYLKVGINKTPSPTLFDVLKHQQELTSLTLYFPSGPAIDIGNPILQCITEDLFYRPVFKAFSYSSSINENIDVILSFLRAFFSSPYPESLSFKNIPCIHFDPLPNPLTIQYSEKKSLKLLNCSFSHSFSSLFPPHLVLKSLEMKGEFDLNGNSCITIFSSLESIEVEVFSISCYVNAENIAIIYSLFSIVTAKSWNLKLKIHDQGNTVPILVDALSAIKPGCLHFLNLKGSILTEENALAILEVVFCSLIPTAEPYFELDISYMNLTEEFGRSIHEKWKECMAQSQSPVKQLKKIMFLNQVDTIEVLMKEVASMVDYCIKFIEKDEY
uniref:Uncharacterized protein n=1 Tax=Amphimedon queenslandica TaxID=400682 RepID=A0A1X7UG96_AMPQE